MTLCRLPALPRPAEGDVAETHPRPRRARHRASKIITGDNRYVAAHVAESVGLDPQRDAHRRGDRHDSTDEALWHARRAHRRCSSRSTRSRRSASCARCSDAAMPSATSATASTMRRPCTRPTSASRSTSAVDVARESADVVLLEPRSRRAAPGRRGRPAHLREHAEVHRHHDQRQLRQHGEHGARDAAAAVPAAGGQADPAQQLPVGPALDRDLDRPRRRRAPREPRSAGTSPPCAAS